MKNYVISLAFMLVFIITNHSLAQINQGNPMEGFKTYPGKLDLGTCRINKFTIGYKLNSNGSQVSVYSNVKWEGDNVSSSCLSNEYFEIFLSIGPDSLPKYIYAGGTDILKVGSGDSQWGINPYSNLINWDKLITKNFGLKDGLQFCTAEEAKAIWSKGFIVRSVKIVTGNRKVFVFK